MRSRFLRLVWGRRENLMRRSLIRNCLCGLAVSLILLPSAAQAWWNEDWPLRKLLTVDTSPQGADIAEPVGAMPLLVRLHPGNFNFAAANQDGSDLRFIAADDKTPLAYHIEHWDSLLGEAFVWVRAPEIAAGATTDFWLYYGNARAATLAETRGAFDDNTVLAYHFAERNQPVRDRSVWNNAALDAGITSEGALIGSGLKLDGQTLVTLPTSPSLNWASGGDMTWSAWIKPEQLQSDAVIFARQDGPNGFVVGIDNGVPFFEVRDPSGVRRGFARPPLQVGSWHHLAVTAAGGQVTFYIDGFATARLGAVLPALSGTAFIGGTGAAPAVEQTEAAQATQAAETAPAADTDPAAADADAEAEAAAAEADAGAAEVQPAAAGRAGFIGELDELRIAKVARSAAFLKASAVGQGPDGASLLTFGLDEQEASWFSGYTLVILGSLSIDGWAIIAILMVIAVISWVVMADKAIYMRRLERSNDRFLASFRQVGGDFAIADRGDAKADATPAAQDSETVRSSSLYRIYSIAVQEVEKRRAHGHAGSLSVESLTAIRAALDAGQVREAQKMNRMLVLLTIAISGGPFFGLLGTVVGVMVTFAAIAAAGDVNVNAIAPGISAALMTTVVGLGVAIPALFGYNWLLTRIRNASATMSVFVDELVTRLAEDQGRSDAPEAAAPIPVSLPAE